jgi:protein-L-isoaspartate(D-aspartate) O-methyltransferase
MSEPPRRGRFPLSLDRAAPTPKRLVEAPHGGAPVPPAPPLRQNNLAAARASVLRAPVPPGAVAAPGGLGLDSAVVRERMVARLRADGCTDEAVLRAFAEVPRHLFVDSALAGQAYEDTSLPIGLGQTISKPTVVARMLELLRRRPGGPELGKVLEIGTGCGYQAALLDHLARQVVSIERLRPLHDKARDNLAVLRSHRLRLVYGDGRVGHPPSAPYDAIIAAAGGEALPPAWLEQLAPGGRLVAPLHDARRGGQVLMVVDRLADGRLQQSVHEAVRFVPLESGLG